MEISYKNPAWEVALQGCSAFEVSGVLSRCSAHMMLFFLITKLASCQESEVEEPIMRYRFIQASVL
jgi:hypothetical protein